MSDSIPHQRLIESTLAICIGDTPLQQRCRDLVEALESTQEQLRTAETTLAHAEAFIEHQDMSYRWAEWCEGRDPA